MAAVTSDVIERRWNKGAENEWMKAVEKKGEVYEWGQASVDRQMSRTLSGNLAGNNTCNNLLTIWLYK